MENNNITPYSLYVTTNGYHESEKTSVLGKRKREIGESEQEEVNEEEYLSKNQKSFYSLGNLSLLPDELIVHLFSYLNPQSCLRYTWVSKACAQFAEDYVWSDYAKRELLDFRWAVCQQRPYPNQENYLLSRVFVNYIIFEPMAHLSAPLKLKNPEKAKSAILATLSKYDRYLQSERFRYLKLFVIRDILKVKGLPVIELPDISFEYMSKLAKEILPEIEANISENSQWGGELLWYGLYKRSYPHLSRAIDQGATCAGLLSLLVHRSDLPDTLDAPPYTWNENLILQAVKKGDRRAFKSYLYRYPARAVAFKEFSFFPTSCFDVIYRKLNRYMDQGKFEEQVLDRKSEVVSFLLDLAINSIKNKETQVIPQEKLAIAFAFIANVKLLVGKLEQAENFFTRAIEATECPRRYLFLRAGHVKFKLGKYLEAEDLFAKARKAGAGDEEELDSAVILVKTHLGKYSEAIELAERAIKIYGNTSSFLPVPLNDLLAMLKTFDKNKSHQDQ